MTARAISELHHLRVALARDHEERGGARDNEEPRRDRHSDRDATGDRAEHEARRDAREIEHGLVLEPDAVQHGLQQVAADDERELPPGGERERNGSRHEHNAAGERGPHRNLARRDRAPALRGMPAIGVDVERVIEEVGPARGQAEAHERDGRAREGGPFAEHPGRAGRGDDENVLDPLLGSRETNERGKASLRLVFGNLGLQRAHRSAAFRFRAVRARRPQPGLAASRRRGASAG